jgi:AcrR family transcriptional regulator
MPKLWDETIDAHRRAVRDATLDTTAALVAEHGLRGVTMSEIAEKTGIGRATLYKYFPDVEAIMLAWHERQIDAHLSQLHDIRAKAAGSLAGLAAVLETYALLSGHASHGHHEAALTAFLHRDEHGSKQRALHKVADLFREVIAEAAASGQVRDDVPPAELASYCINALSAARALNSDAAVRRLIAVVLSGLQPQP